MSRKPVPMNETHKKIIQILKQAGDSTWVGSTEIGKALGKAPSSASSYVAPFLKFLLNRRIIKRSVKAKYRLSLKGLKTVEPVKA